MNYTTPPQPVNYLAKDMPQNSVLSSANEGIGKRIEELSHALKELASRIAPTLRPVPILAAGIGAKPSTEPVELMSDLTQNLRNHGSALDRIISEVNELRDRCEV